MTHFRPTPPGTLAAQSTGTPGVPIPASPREGQWPVVEVEDPLAARSPQASRGLPARPDPARSDSVAGTGAAIGSGLLGTCDLRKARFGPRRPGSAPVIVAAGLLGLLLAITGIWLSAANWMRGEPWTPRVAVLVGAKWSTNLLGMGVGLWWWRRAPTYPTGRLLYLAVISDCFFVIGITWPGSAWATELAWAEVFGLPLCAWIVLGWPTGRPNRRTRRAVSSVVIAGTVINLVVGVFRKSPAPDPDWPDPPHALFSVPEVWQVLDPVQALVFTAVPALGVMILLIRRWRAVPFAVRPLITPITVAGMLVAISLVVLHVGYQVFGALIPDADSGKDYDIGVVRLLILLGPYCSIGIVAVGVLVGATRRRRAVAVGVRRLLVDLRSATPVVSPSVAAADTVGDPSAVVRYRRPDGSWIDGAGRTLGAVGSDRRLIPVVAESGETMAALEVAASLAVPPLLADLAVSVIAAQAANERATALAESRRQEVLSRSRELVMSADAGRRDLERNLHDGAQQLLVGLALNAGLAARRVAQPAKDEADQGMSGDPADAVIEQIGVVGREIVSLVDAAAPAALSGGLAGAVRTLATVSPISTSIDVSGDLGPDDPIAVGLYLAVGEAMANAVKHSEASWLVLRVVVDPGRVQITVQDNGIGGVDGVPQSLADRMAALNGHVHLQSPAGGGTVVHIELDRRAAAGQP